jgi:hypothetical protein
MQTSSESPVFGSRPLQTRTPTSSGARAPTHAGHAASIPANQPAGSRVCQSMKTPRILFIARMTQPITMQLMGTAK